MTLDTVTVGGPKLTRSQGTQTTRYTSRRLYVCAFNKYPIAVSWNWRGLWCGLCLRHLVVSVYSLASAHIWDVLPLAADGTDPLPTQLHFCLVSGPKVLNFDLSPITFPFFLDEKWDLPSNASEGNPAASLGLVQTHSCGWHLASNQSFVGQCH